MTNKICCVFNIGPHYRESIYSLMDKSLNCDFYFGDKVDSPIKIMDYTILKGYKKTVKNLKVFNSGFLWQSGVWRLAFGNYSHYILTGSPYIISNYVLSIFARLQNKKVYIWTHGVKGNSNWKKKILEHITIFLANKVLLYGNYAKVNMIEKGYSEEKLIPIYNSLGYETQLSVRKNLSAIPIFENHFKNKYPVIIYIGRIQKSKKVDLLVDAIAILKLRGILCNLVIIGKDIDGNEIPSIVEKHKLSNSVWFYGPCYDENKIGNLIFNSDVCISPGLIGLTAIHALTYGTPVLTSDQFSKHGPEFEAVEIGVTGDFFKSDDLEDLCVKIQQWINLDNAKRELIRQNCFAKIDTKYNPFVQLNILERTLN